MVRANVTNTSSRSQAQLQQKLASLGIDAQLEECYPSGVFAAEYIRHQHPNAKLLYVIGGTGLMEELEKHGFQCDGGPLEQYEIEENQFAAVCNAMAGTSYDGVVVGWDIRFSFRKLVVVNAILTAHPNCFFYATNDDPYDKVDGHVIPGTGMILSSLHFLAVASASVRNDKEQPFSSKAVVLGKPNPEFVRQIAQCHGINLSESIFVGDRLDTDILMGNKAGMQTLLVETGVHSRADIQRLGIHPTWTLRAFGNVLGLGKL